MTCLWFTGTSVKVTQSITVNSIDHRSSARARQRVPIPNTTTSATVSFRHSPHTRRFRGQDRAGAWRGQGPIAVAVGKRYVSAPAPDPFRLNGLTPSGDWNSQSNQSGDCSPEGSTLGSDSMLMHFEVTVSSVSKGNRCHGQRYHARSMRTDNRTYRTRAGRTDHRGSSNVSFRGLSNLRATSRRQMLG